MDFLDFFESLATSIVILTMLVGLAGTVVPLLPGSFLIWLSLLGFGWVDKWDALSLPIFGLMSVVLAVTGTAEWWLPLLGAKASGADRRSLFYGIAGALLGLFLFPPFGSILGYAAGVLLGSYQKHGDLNLAMKASMGNLAGQGLAAVVQFIGGLIVIGWFIALIS